MRELYSIWTGMSVVWPGEEGQPDSFTEPHHPRIGQSPSELGVLHTQDAVKRLLDNGLTISPLPSTGPGSGHVLSKHERSSSSPLNSGTFSIFTRPSGRFLTDHNNRDSERYVGPTSLDSLILDIKDVIAEHTESENQSLQECAQLAQCKINHLVGLREEELLKNGSPPTVPPFAILDAMIEPYFASINRKFPIWTKERFVRMATALQHSPSPEQDVASIVCCNNLILMTLTATSLSSRRGKSVHMQKFTRKTSSIDSDLIAGFLTNAKRAFENIDQIVSPRLINVQALLSLVCSHLYQPFSLASYRNGAILTNSGTVKCIVAREHLSTELAETIFALATRCAKSIGIHQWQCLQGQFGDEDILVRRNVSYCLYILDKALCWTTGTSPSVPISEIHLDPTLMASDDRDTAYLAAKAELAKIEEVIHLEIYASHAKARTEDEVRRFVSHIMHNLQAWLTNSGIDLDEVEDINKNSSAAEVELGISFLSAQLLLIWPYRNHPDVIFQQSLEVARSIVASYPPLYLYEVYTRILSDQGQNSDTELLQDFIEMLRVVTDSREGKSYNRRLYQMSLIIIDLSAATKVQHKRRKTESDIEQLRTVVSQLPVESCNRTSPVDNTQMIEISSPSDSYNRVRLGVLEPENQGFDSTAFLDFEVDSFALMAPLESNTCELAVPTSADELVSNMGSYTAGLFGDLSSIACTLGSLTGEFGERET
ncbi:hypothetical protein FQN57_004851 [Myotisia sp. PD_48]|nr:hypothetical protein FQN57_004851 [Myotisia sp. PD_48]